MVQVFNLPQKYNFGAALGQSVGQGFQQGMGSQFEQALHMQRQQQASDLQSQRQQQMAKLQQQQAAQEQSRLQQALAEYEQQNPDIDPLMKQQLGLYKALSGHPEIAKQLGAGQQKLAQQKQEQEFNNSSTEQNKQLLESYFGPEFADLYTNASEGGKTKLLDAAIDAKQRGMEINDVLKPLADQIKAEEEISKPRSEQKIDFDRGLKPKEKIARQGERYSKNLPLYQESSKKIKNLEYEKRALDTLSELNQSGKLPENLGRLNVNLKSGELIVPALASPEAQLYVKTINDFTTQAKDSYGSRVTNFDLQQFMKRLPTLANTSEGRDKINEQMKMINELNTLNEESVRDVIDEYGGIRNIDYDQAERIAEKKINGRKKEILKEYRSGEKSLNDSYKRKVDELRSQVPEGHVLVEKDEDLGYIPKSKLPAAIKNGYKKL